MKTISQFLFLALLCFAGAANATNSRNIPCVAIYAMTASYVSTALDAAAHLSDYDVTSISANRNENTVIADIEFQNGKKTKLQVEQQCNGKLQVSEVKKAYPFQCRKFVDCMPMIGLSDEKQIERDAYCSQDYKEWAKANCGYEPLKAN